MEDHDLFETLYRHASAHPTRPALIAAAQTISYQDLAQIAANGRRRFLAVGGDNCLVGVSIANELEHLIASIALAAAGASQITLPTYETEGARALLATRAAVTHVLSDDQIYALPGAHFLHWPGFDNLPAGHEDDPTEPSRKPLFLLRTTGTTLDANILAFSEQQVALQAKRYPEYGEDRLLRLASIEYNTSKRHRLYCLWRGGSNVFRTRGSLSDVVAFAAQRDVTCLDVSRMHLAEILALKAPKLPAQMRLRPGGGPVSSDLRRRIIDEVTANLYVRYAATECGAIAMAGPSDHDEDAPCGVPLPDIALEIVGEDGAVAAQGVTGEIRIKAPGMADCYLDNSALTERRFRDGWFYPGDIGRLRGDGQIVVCGRKDDMIILNGVNIFPEEIEAVLERHPDVVSAAGVPLDSSVHGQIPVAAVELRAGARVTTADLLKYARDHLALRTPRRILIVEEMPRNEQGKILKREIRNRFLVSR